MAKYEHKPNSGSAFKNDRKQKETHPDFTGTLNVEGQEYWLSIWTNKDRKPPISVSIKKKDPMPQQSTPADDGEDDLF